MPSTMPDAFFRHPLNRVLAFSSVSMRAAGQLNGGGYFEKNLNFKIRNANGGVLQKACETPLLET
ncbi:MAG: hypothetical protein DBX63_06115 [Clostridia bacterium]|nr:MAG: hypothetical protein DBX63_06115 [Clostridia bacterium]